MVVDKRTVLNARVHVRWTAKRGNEIDLIGPLNVARLLGHSRGSASREDFKNSFICLCYTLKYLAKLKPGSHLP